ncbi:MAG TPA: MFS transporter [Xanthobacteraceae bacterium]|nr:MFS transporter [Xanthobacteraceae bacterium]
MTSEANASVRFSGVEIESSYAWLRLGIALALGTIGSIGMWSFVVALPAVQADFGVPRGEASLPFTLTMLGFGFGGVVTGRFADRYGIVPPAFCGALTLGIGYVASGMASSIWWFALAQGLIGFGSSATFGPLMTDISHWFSRRRGIAVAIASCGNYLAGTIWPPLVQYFIATEGWRTTQIGIGVMCVATMLPLVLALRRRAPVHEAERIGAAAVTARGSLGISSKTLMVLLCIAGVACCVAMAMPQAHIVAYCGDLGYGPARGAEMLALMMGFGIVSRLAAGLVADRIGGLATLLIASLLQGVALFLYLWFDGLTSLYVISALFGLFQGGIVPMYAIIVREYFAPYEAGTRLGIVLLATLLGMALGGWMSGAIFDLAGSYRAAFLNGLLWNLLNVAIMLWLLMRQKRRAAYA